MTVQEAIQARYSCRKYEDRPVETSVLKELVTAGRQAPSACNSQRWMLLAVDNPTVLAQITPSMYHETWKINRFAENVPAFIVMIEHPLRNPTPMQQDLLGSDGRGWSQQDLGGAVQTICLAATAMGLGSVIMGWFDEALLKSTLGIPAEMTVPVVIGVGYPLDPSKSRGVPRLASEELFRYNHFSTAFPVEV